MASLDDLGNELKGKVAAKLMSAGPSDKREDLVYQAVDEWEREHNIEWKVTSVSVEEKDDGLQSVVVGLRPCADYITVSLTFDPAREA